MSANTIELISFGFLHTDGRVPESDLAVDTRRFLSDPATARQAGVLDMDGRDVEVQQIVARTPGAVEAIRVIGEFADGFPDGRHCVIAVGCAGGKHRSVAISVLAAGMLLMRGYEVRVRHLHVHLPRVLTAAEHATAADTATGTAGRVDTAEPVLAGCR